MKAMQFKTLGKPLLLAEIPKPSPGPNQILLKVKACGVCRTDLHVVEGDLRHPKLPLIPGHEIVGEVVEQGPSARNISVGDRVGVPWLGTTCGQCAFCRQGRENLCERAQFTGYDLDGGYAEYVLADSRFCFALPPSYSDSEAAPLLCAGLIGYRSLKKAGAATRLGLYGFGAAAHILAQVAIHQGREVYALTRPGDRDGQDFAREMGCRWAGGSDEPPPVPLEAAILFAPVGSLIPQALRTIEKGGRVVCAGIHMSEIPSFPYEILWGEREILSVANLTRRDGEEFFQLAAKFPIHTRVHPYPLEEANRALKDLKEGRIHGAGVLTMAPGGVSQKIP